MVKKLVISYSDDDRDIAIEVRDQLAKAGYGVWIAREDIRGSVDWTQSILNAIDSSDGLILVWSEFAARSEDVHEEIRIARVFLKPIFPIRARPMTRVPALPNEIKTLQVIRIGDLGANVAELKARLADPERSNIQYAKLAEHGFIPKASNPYFVGRSRELKDLFIDSRGYRGVTKKGIPIAITGLAGIGKTQLALAFGYRFNLFFTDGVYWVDAPSGIVHEFGKIGQHIGLEVFRDERPRDYAIRVRDEKLRQMPNGLIIFDNITNFTEFREWCPEASNSCSVILTTRMSPRGFPARMMNLTELDSDSAYEMLMARRNDRAEISRDKAQREALKELCRITGNHPLALELCAFRLQSEFIKPSDYLKDIQTDPLGRLSDEKKSAVSLGVGTASLSEILRHSYTSVDEKMVDPYFLLMCCFAPHGINKELIVQSYGEPVKGGRALDQLASISFIRSELSNTLSLHPLVAQFGRNLQKHQDFDYPGKFTEVMLGFLRAHENNLAGEDVRREKPHIDEALRVAQDNKMWEACATLHEYNAVIEVRVHEHIESLKKAYQIIEQRFPQQKRRLLGLRLRLGMARRTAGQLNDALNDFNQAEVLCGEIKNVDPAMTASLRFELGSTRLELGRYSEAEKTLSDALKVALTAFDNFAPVVLQLRQALAEHALALGDHDTAKAGFTEILGLRKTFYTAQPDTTSAAGLASAYADLSRLALARTHYPEAIQFANEALKIAKEYYKESDPECSNLYLLLGAIYYESGDYGRADEQLETARGNILTTFGEWHPNYARAIIELGEVHRKQGRFNKAKEEIQQAAKIFERAYGENHPSVAEALEVQAKIYDHLDELDKEQTIWERILNIQHQFYSEQHPALAKTHCNYASLFLRKGEYDKAADHLQSSLRIIEQKFGKTHACYFACLVRLAACRYEQQQYARAQETLNEARGLQNAIFGDSHHPYVARMLQLESEIQRRIGRFVKAMDYIDQAIAMKETIYGKEHPSVAEAMEVKVKIYHHLGEKVDAKVLIDRALEIRLNAYGENHPEVSRSIHDLGSYYLRLGQYEAAVKQFERVRQITATVFGDRHPDYVVDTIDLANALYQQGKYQLALGLVEEVKDALPQGNHYLRARWLQLMSEIQQRQGKFKDALEFIDQAIAMKETIYGKEHPSVAESLEVKVDLMLGQLNHQDSSEVLDTIERIRSKAYSKSHPEYANYLLRRAKWYEIDGRYDDASEVLKQSLQICLNAFSARHPATSRRQIMLARMDRMANRIVGAEDRIKGVCETLGTRLETEDSLIVAETLQELSYIRRAQGDYHAALAELEKALRVEATIFSSESPEVIELQNEKAKLLILFHRLTEAEDIIESALRYVELDQPIYKRLKSNLLGQLGILLVYKKEYDQAIENVEEAIQLKKHLLGAENVELGRLYIEKAWVLRRLSKYNESFATLEATHNIDNLHFDENHIYFARILLEQGQTYLDKKSFWEAQEHLREALQIYDKQLNKNVKQHADAAEALGRSYLETGFLNEATEMFQKAMEIRTAIYGSLHPEIAETLYYQAQALLKMSESRENEDSKTKARQKLEQALNMLGQSSVFNVELVSKIEHTLAAL